MTLNNANMVIQSLYNPPDKGLLELQGFSKLGELSKSKLKNISQ